MPGYKAARRPARDKGPSRVPPWAVPLGRQPTAHLRADFSRMRVDFPQLADLPLRANSTAKAKLGRLRRWVPAWNTCPVRRNVSASAKLWAMFLRAGLLAVHVLARLGSQDRGQTMPVRSGGDQHGVDVVAGEQVAEIAIRGAVGIAVLVRRPSFGGARLRPSRRTRPHTSHPALAGNSPGRTIRGDRCRWRPARSARWARPPRLCPGPRSAPSAGPTPPRQTPNAPLKNRRRSSCTVCFDHASPP